jgi:hypothetical protein
MFDTALRVRPLEKPQRRQNRNRSHTLTIVMSEAEAIVSGVSVAARSALAGGGEHRGSAKFYENRGIVHRKAPRVICSKHPRSSCSTYVDPITNRNAVAPIYRPSVLGHITSGEYATRRITPSGGGVSHPSQQELTSTVRLTVITVRLTVTTVRLTVAPWPLPSRMSCHFSLHQNPKQPGCNFFCVFLRILFGFIRFRKADGGTVASTVADVVSFFPSPKSKTTGV